MNLEDALRCLLLRLLRNDRLVAEASGSAELVSRLSAMAEGLTVERHKAAKEYRVMLAGVDKVWTIPETDFVFYSRGDQVPPGGPPAVSLEDAIYETNLAHARRWLGVFKVTCNA